MCLAVIRQALLVDSHIRGLLVPIYTMNFRHAISRKESSDSYPKNPSRTVSMLRHIIVRQSRWYFSNLSLSEYQNLTVPSRRDLCENWNNTRLVIYVKNTSASSWSVDSCCWMIKFPSFRSDKSDKIRLYWKKYREHCFCAVCPFSNRSYIIACVVILLGLASAAERASVLQTTPTELKVNHKTVSDYSSYVTLWLIAEKLK